MRVLHVIYNLTRTSGGPSRSVQGIVGGLNRIGVETWLLSAFNSDDPWEDDIPYYVNGQTLSNGGFFSLSYKRRLRSVILRIKPELVHIHGIWNWRIHCVVGVCAELGIPYAISPRGALSQWALSQRWWKKYAALLLFQRSDLKNAVFLHATSEGEASDIRNLGLTNRVVVLPNGVSFPDELPAFDNAHDGDRRMLFLSRIHSVKGLIELVRAWAKVPKNGWILRIVGNDKDGYWETVRREIKVLGVEDSVRYEGAVLDDRKWAVYRSSDCFVLPSFSENFGIVIAEALYAGIPVIASTATPWSFLPHENAGWWVDNNPDALAKSMSLAMSISDAERTAMGIKGRRCVVERYEWDAIARRMEDAYNEVLK